MNWFARLAAPGATLLVTALAVGDPPAPIPLASTASATAAPNFEEPPKSRAAALENEAKDALPMTAFYTPPAGLVPAPGGTLIRAEPFDGYALPKGARAIRTG